MTTRMTAKTTRILKEARFLFWPWCALIAAGALRLVEQSSSALREGGPFAGVHYFVEPVGFLGFFIGIPLLATLSLGSEFQHRTLPLLLSQPVERMGIWGEKLSVTIAAALSAALVFCLSWRAALYQDSELWMIAGAWIISMIASATFWTLIARSTLGGLVLNGGVNYVFVAVWLFRPDWIPRSMTARSIGAFALLCYAGVMLWLGRRTLARFQLTGGMAGDDLLMAGPSVMPERLAGWFHCRPTGVVLNLIRKELRLLRPLWLITPLGLLGWMYLSLLGYKLERGSVSAVLSVPAVIIVIALTPLIAVLAGTLSLGEESSSGTHSWHMTLPVSARRQWLIKLLVALCAGLVCAALLPILVLSVGRFLLGSPFLFVDVHGGMLWALGALLLSFASFWCACVVKGTVRAALWLFPLMFALALAGQFGNWIAPKLVDFAVSRFDLFTDFRFTNSVSNLQSFVMLATPLRLVTILMAPVLLIAVIQSYRLYRAQLQDGTLSVIRNLLPLAIVVFLCAFSLMAFYVFVAHARQQMWTMFRETHEAIENIQPGSANLDATHPLQLTAEDLVKAAPLSQRTQRWLRNSRITIAPDKPNPGAQYCCRGNAEIVTVAPGKPYSSYLVTVHLPRGSGCTLSFQPFGHGNGILGGVCE
jgi:ABC-type transport system involved in multi-copper enzyme maturation permease subunit